MSNPDHYHRHFKSFSPTQTYVYIFLFDCLSINYQYKLGRCIRIHIVVNFLSMGANSKKNTRLKIRTENLMLLNSSLFEALTFCGCPNQCWTWLLNIFWWSNLTLSKIHDWQPLKSYCSNTAMQYAELWSFFSGDIVLYCLHSYVSTTERVCLSINVRQGWEGG